MKHLAVLLICFLTIIPSLAQDAPPVITPENAAALTLLDSAGSDLPARVSFSPDGRYLFAHTLLQTFAYRTGDLDAAPHIFPFSTFRFGPGGDLIIGGGQRWKLETGLPVDSAGVRFSQSEGQPIMIDVTTPEGETIRIETGVTGGFSSAAVNDDYTVLALEVGGDHRQRIHDTTYIYQLPEGRLIAALPQRRDDFPITRLHFTESRRGEILMIEAEATGHMYEGDVTLIQMPQGAVELEYSGVVLDDVRFSPDGKFAYELTDKLVYGTGSIIGSIPRFDEDDWMTMQFFSVTATGMAMVSDKSILRIARFQPDGGLSDIVTVALDDGVFRRWSAAGEHVVMNEFGAISVWDIASGSPEPRVIEIDPAIPGNAIVEFSPDLTHYRHWDGLRYTMRDTATHEPLGDYRGDQVTLSPDWSLAAYWDGGRLVVDDLLADQRREFDLLDG